jgi:hypothetical protein
LSIAACHHLTYEYWRCRGCCLDDLVTGRLVDFALQARLIHVDVDA